MKNIASLWWSCRNLLLPGLAALLMSGCVMPAHPPSQDQSSRVIGSLEATGPNVFYNGRKTPGGHAVRSGDNVSTGPGSRATVRLTTGGTVMIDENTDPDFFQEAWCILVKIVKGQVYASGSGICFETPHASGVIHSEVNIRVTPKGSVVTVLTGSADIQRPVSMQLHPSGQARFAMGKAQQVRSLSSVELRSVFQWIGTMPERGAQSDSRYCRSYAQTALSQQRENLERGCGFSGGRWSADFNRHFRWCLQAPESAAEGETKARALSLEQQCLATGSMTDSRERCQQYAETAISQQNENLRRQCGFTGNQWSRDFNFHYRWCTQVPQTSTDAETKSRGIDLRRCSRRQPDLR